ncbi:hypothetical protein [Natrinema pallidum]|uniref:Uncharacterized protein n=2 Tax=Natrinema pallidum TaxID=69527 RepID=L9YM94_9EURY|nr:hypothetical protein [Natrinema pallidum]ELY74796.1 hypothetical protein C487_14119 [Natrinema pallidum DSM 3751]QCW04399.1 hypothetical protein FGF80_14670 [Natrinema pallidum]
MPFTIRRDVVLAILALGLLAASLWVLPLHVDEPTYRYERTAVTAGNGSIDYADADAVSHETPLRDEIACTDGIPWDSRACAFERLLLENRTVPTDIQYGSAGRVWPPVDDRYQYVLLNETVYETIYIANESARQNDGYRIDLALERTTLEQVLRDVSIPVTADEVSPTIAEAARSGAADSHRKVETPDTPIRLEDESFQYVTLAERSAPSLPARGLDFLLTYLAPLLGLSLLGHLSRRVEVTYVGNERR